MLSNEQIDTMGAGRETDALIAVRVMKWLPHRRHSACYVNAAEVNSAGEKFVIQEFIDEWRPSQNIADAWRVVEKLSESGWNYIQVDRDDGLWGADFAKLEFTEYGANGTVKAHSTASDSAPLAICRAALKAALTTKQEERDGRAGGCINA